MTNMEVDTNINGNTNIVLGGHVVDGAVESNGVLGDHRTDSVLAAATVPVAASISWLHDAVSLSVYLLQSVHTVGNVDLAITGGVIDEDHNRNTTWVRL